MALLVDGKPSSRLSSPFEATPSLSGYVKSLVQGRVADVLYVTLGLYITRETAVLLSK